MECHQIRDFVTVANRHGGKFRIIVHRQQQTLDIFRCSFLLWQYISALSLESATALSVNFVLVTLHEEGCIECWVQWRIFFLFFNVNCIFLGTATYRCLSNRAYSHHKDWMRRHWWYAWGMSATLNLELFVLDQMYLWSIKGCSYHHQFLDHMCFWGLQLLWLVLS